MALSLRAEQKNITDLFNSGEDIYVIPEYQRPYSWNKDTTYQLYSDITSHFLDNEDYFVGNIIMARGQEERKRPNIVDGQQRLITLWIWIKVLTVLHPNKSRINRLLTVESLLSDNILPRIDSKVFEHDDQQNIEDVKSFTKDDFEKEWNDKVNSKGDISEQKTSRIEANALYLYKWMKEFYENLGNDKKKCEDFLQYFLEKVYLLPIELGGNDINEASDRALTIFETLNNRGQLLEDSDIFKARLYKSAKQDGKENEFIEQWFDFNSVCSELHMTVDELFRYYYHILRAEEGQTTNEGSLREYLTKDSNSALSVKPYKNIVDDLSNITNILQWMSAPSKMDKKIARYVQLLGQYTNQYPRYALVNYLFVEGFEDKFKLERFLRAIVRYYYYRGATLQVKYETYRINKLVANHQNIPKYDCSDIEPEYFNHLGLLRNGYALLAHYLLYKDSYEENIFFDKIVFSRDSKYLDDDWKNVDVEDIKNNIANIVVLDMPKKTLNIPAKATYYSKSELKDVRSIFAEGVIYQYARFCKREKRLKNALMAFFKDIES